ncbi:hypothetical protein GALMADRAFT_230699 [Galerina marginata CBS 339.88]|uniref:DUF6533 domain-containing protein n=1 Tax=Galerina marginata (strain CBS 339.88) TaxID=685588 RepID=A0A067SPD0_GALM3|nr:hypothetical protein GALMADRAFT_230699 [Galerina marginata CBS 339.88]
MDAATVEWLFADRALALLYLSSATCVIYDHLTTLDVEVELIWKKPRQTAVQPLFFVNRYVGDSRFIAVILGYLNAIVLSSMQAIMIYRLSSMYNNDWKITAFLFIALVLEMAGITVVQIVASRVRVPIPKPAPGISQCAGMFSPPWMFTIWIPIVCFEVLVLSLTLSRAIHHYRSTRASQESWLSPLQWNNPESLTYILLRDSIMLPFISVVICLSNIFISVHLPYLVSQMGICVASFSPCIVGSRLILNLREAYYQPFIYECNIGTNLEDEIEASGFMNNLDLNDIPNIPINNILLA